MGAWNPHAGLVYRPPTRTPTWMLFASSSVRAISFPKKQIVIKSLHDNSAHARPPDIHQRPYSSFTVRVHTCPPEHPHTPRSDFSLFFFSFLSIFSHGLAILFLRFFMARIYACTDDPTMPGSSHPTQREHITFPLCVHTADLHSRLSPAHRTLYQSRGVPFSSPSSAPPSDKMNLADKLNRFHSYVGMTTEDLPTPLLHYIDQICAREPTFTIFSLTCIAPSSPPSPSPPSHTATRSAPTRTTRASAASRPRARPSRARLPRRHRLAPRLHPRGPPTLLRQPRRAFRRQVPHHLVPSNSSASSTAAAPTSTTTPATDTNGPPLLALLGVPQGSNPGTLPDEMASIHLRTALAVAA